MSLAPGVPSIAHAILAASTNSLPSAPWKDKKPQSPVALIKVLLPAVDPPVAPRTNIGAPLLSLWIKERIRLEFDVPSRFSSGPYAVVLK